MIFKKIFPILRQLLLISKEIVENHVLKKRFFSIFLISSFENTISFRFISFFNPFRNRLLKRQFLQSFRNRLFKRRFVLQLKVVFSKDDF